MMVRDTYTGSGRVTRGHFQMRDRPAFESAMRIFKEGEVVVTITHRRATRSLSQNAYYWGVVVQLLSAHTGHSPDEIHEILKAKFLPKTLAVQDGNGQIVGEYVIGGTTTSLNKTEFGEYVIAIQQWALDKLGVDIPDPSEVAA